LKLFNSILVLLLPVFSLSAMPSPTFQELGTANLSFASTGTIGTTIGALDYSNVKGEVEFGYNFKNTTPLSIAAKIGVDEGIITPNAPSLCAGIFSSDFKTTAEPLVAKNILYVMTSKSWEKSRIGIGYFNGNKNMGAYRDGIFVSFTQALLVEKIDEIKQRSILNLQAEYVFGKSILSGAKVELVYQISDRLSIRTGPSWSFSKLDPSISKWNGKNIKWLMSFSINI